MHRSELVEEWKAYRARLSPDAYLLGSYRVATAPGLCALLVGVAGNTALAGEITGKGKSLKQPDGGLHGKSACAFLGLNETYSGDPNVPDADGFFRTQNWGQIDQPVRATLAGIGLHPGSACNPTVSPNAN